MQLEAVKDLYLYKTPITWISSYFCLHLFSSIFEPTLFLLGFFFASRIKKCDYCLFRDNDGRSVFTVLVAQASVQNESGVCL